MNAASMPSTISSTVAAEIFGPGSFFGSCQVSSSNFEVLFDNVLKQSDAEWKKESGTILQSEGLLEIENSDELSNILQIFMQGKSESEVMQQLKAILGDEAGVEAFERIVALLEKGSLSVQKDMDNLSLLDFIDLSESLLERLELVIKQISYVNEALVIKQNIQNEDLFEMEKFLNLLSDLLKIGL
ncbi:MAG: hypothetical protein LBC85_01775, partial [Fibromonadaceae bacterium]|nr:hypothetical protein [Fibromonadaceae bacterium]